jgi:hypothetical protein
MMVLIGENWRFISMLRRLVLPLDARFYRP